MLWTFLEILLPLSLTTLAQSQQLTQVTQAFIDSHVVPDVLPDFHPSLSFQVSFLNTTIVPGQNLTKESISSFHCAKPVSDPALQVLQAVPLCYSGSDYQ